MRAIIISSMDEQSQNPTLGKNTTPPSDTPPSGTTGAPLFPSPAGTTEPLSSAPAPAPIPAASLHQQAQPTPAKPTPSGAGNLPPSSSAPKFPFTPANPQSPAPSANEAVIIDSGSSKTKVSGKLIVAIILTVVLLVGGGVGAVFLLSNGNNPFIPSSSSFPKLANYILDNNGYTLTNAVEDNNTNYMTTAQQYLENYQKSNPKNTEEATALLGSFTDIFNFLHEYVNAKAYTDDELLSEYIKNGSSELSHKIEEKYAPLLKTSYEPGKAFAEAKQNHDKAMLKVLEIYDTNNCLTDNKIDDQCVATINPISESENQKIQAALTDQNIDLIYNIAAEAEDICNQLSKAITSGGSND